MQFHHHGYVSTDPRIKAASGCGIDRSAELPDTADVLVVGEGPAGIVAAAQLSVFPDITTVLVEQRGERLKLGHADGIQARSVETFQAFGFANEIIDEAYRITETAFWKADPHNPERIVRTGITPDDPHGISEFPHLIVNQARVVDRFREFAAHQASKTLPYYGWEFLDLEIGEGEYPVAARLRRSCGENEGEERTIRAKYVVGGDGARSGVRASIGATHKGNISYHAWGVADILVDTDFPDIRTKYIINSSKGSILHIPREGGYLFRTYVDLGEVAADDNHEVRKTPLETIIAKANAIMAPYRMDVKEVAWWSVYEVGHRVTDRFDDVPKDAPAERMPRVFIMGDACHTHSAKAGQGMNVSMQDAFNLGWKLAQVLRGRSSEKLLKTYNGERQQIAQDLIDFDLEWSGRMAGAGDGENIEDFYVRTAEFPAGFMTEYPPSQVIASDAVQELATGYPLGKRFRSALVTRRCDANDVHLGHLHEADGRWRVYVFADSDSPVDPDSKARAFADWWANDPASPMVRTMREGDDASSVFDLKVIYQQGVHDYEITDVPAAFRPRVGPYALEDWNEVFSAIPGEDVFDIRGVSRNGAVVLVRPDMYVAHIAPLEGVASIASFLEGVFDR